MDWIERWFGVSPDNGDGTLEVVVFVVLAVVAVAMVVSSRPAWRRAVAERLAAVGRWLLGHRA